MDAQSRTSNLFKKGAPNSCILNSEEINTLRGLACFLLVFFHVVGHDYNSGFKIESGILRDINDALAFYRMPIFSFLSGVVYAYRPYNGGLGFYIGKFKRLIVPFLTVGIIFVLFRELYRKEFYDCYHCVVFEHVISPYTHYWFLYAVFWIFIVASVFDRLSVFLRKDLTVVLFVVSVILYLFNFRVDYFSIKGAMYLMPYFVLGCLIVRSKISINNNLVGIFLLCFSALLVCFFYKDMSVRSVNGLSVSMIGLLGLFLTRPNIGFFAKIGIFSYSIFLFHVFFTSVVRFFLSGYDFHIGVLVFISVAGGVFFPIVVDLFFSKSSYASLLFLGKSKKKKLKVGLA